MSIGANGKMITRLPSHPQPQLEFTADQQSRMARGRYDSFTYYAPVVKYAPAQFQPGPVYFGGEAASIGKQPYNFSDTWTAYSQPHGLVPNNMQIYKGSQSTASFAVASNAIAMMLASRSQK